MHLVLNIGLMLSQHYQGTSVGKYLNLSVVLNHTPYAMIELLEVNMFHNNGATWLSLLLFSHAWIHYADMMHT